MPVSAQEAAAESRPVERRSLATGAVLMGGLRLATLGTNAIVSLVIARLLGPAGSGTFAVAAGLLATLLVFTTCGVDIGAIWMVSGRRWSATSAWVTAQAATLVLGVLGAGLGLLVYAVASSTLLGGLSLTMVTLAVAGLPFALAVQYGSQIALAMERYEAAVGMPAALSLTYVIATAVLGAADGLEGAVVGIFVAQVIGGAATVWWGTRRLLGGAGRKARRIDLTRLREALRFGVQPYIAAVLSVLTLRFDLFVLNASAPRREVGYYAVAVALTNAIWLLPAAMSGVLFPRIASLARDESVGKETMERAETKSLRHTSVQAAAASALMCVGMLFLLKPIYGARFGPALDPALLLVPGAFATGFALTSYTALSGRGRPRYVMIGGIITTITAVALYLAIVPPLGADGAAIASSIAYITNALLAGFFLRRVSGEPVLPRLRPGREELRDYARLLARVRAAVGRD